MVADVTGDERDATGCGLALDAPRIIVSLSARGHAKIVEAAPVATQQQVTGRR